MLEPEQEVERNSIISKLTEMKRFICQDSQGLAEKFHELTKEFQQQEEGYRQYIKALLESLLISCVRNNHQLINMDEKKNDLIVQGKVSSNERALIIDQYFLGDCRYFSLASLADILKLSPRQTQRMIKKFYGKSFFEKALEAKMNVAILLLTDTRESMTSISDYIGYSSPEHFSYAFRHYFGVSPSEYRKKAIAKTSPV